MTRLFAAFALSAALASPAFAGPTLRAEALVTDEFVTMGDLFDHAEGLEGIALFRAPDPGETGPLTATAALAAARRAGVPGAEAGGVRQVFVTRASREVTLAEMAATITARAATELGVDVDAVEVALDASVQPVHVDPALKSRVEVARFVVDPKSGRFEAQINVPGRSRALPLIHVTGQATETVEVATLSRPIGRGDLIAKGDIRADRRPKSQASDAVTPAEVAGLAARRPLREGQPLRAGDLMRPQHVERGGFVTLVYAGQGVSLSLKAKSLASGSAGDLISVQNLQSKKVVSGVVTGPSEVTVTAAPTALANR